VFAIGHQKNNIYHIDMAYSLLKANSRKLFGQSNGIILAAARKILAKTTLFCGGRLYCGGFEV